VPSYSSKFADDPPGPYVSVRIASSVDFRDVEGILDTGADQTFIPLVTARELKLRRIGDVNVGDANGGWKSSPIYKADLTFGGLSFPALPVGGIEFPIVLIGRDILNDLLVTFDGPGLTFTFSQP
jgi:predicted aspartyl protease